MYYCANVSQSFHKHLLGKRHARTILEKQGKELDVEEFKNFSMVREWNIIITFQILNFSFLVLFSKVRCFEL